MTDGKLLVIQSLNIPQDTIKSNIKNNMAQTDKLSWEKLFTGQA